MEKGLTIKWKIQLNKEFKVSKKLCCRGCARLKRIKERIAIAKVHLIGK